MPIINKEHGAGAREVNATIVAPGITGRALGMALVAPNGDLGARAGITLGGAEIVDTSWDGKWTDLNECMNGKTQVKIPAASVIVVRLSLNR